MKRRQPSLVSHLLGLLLLLAASWEILAWLSSNPLPDGYQNEYLHVGNAFDLWTALRQHDIWHLKHYVTNSYWPPLFYAATWPLQAVAGMRHSSLVLGNLLWLALALGSIYHLAGRSFAGNLAMLLFVLCPGVFGSMVRFEPNIAQMATLALSLLALERSRGFTNPRYSALVGAFAGLGLMTDRLGTLPFLLVPLSIVVPTSLRAWRRDQRPGLPGQDPTPIGAVTCREPGSTCPPWRGLLLAALCIGVIALPWYSVWLSRQLSEVTRQLATGEIDSTGTLTWKGSLFSPKSWLYYPLTLLDSQAGPILGSAMLLSLLMLRRRSLLATVLGGWFLFGLIQKKQVFYTLPLLVPLSVSTALAVQRMAALRHQLSLLLLAAGLYGYSGRMWGRDGPVLDWASQPNPLPASWVSPRHVLARPPSGLWIPLEDWVQTMKLPQQGESGHMVIFSEDPVLFEGFLVLLFREALPSTQVHALGQDPVGTYEWFRASSHFLVIAEAGAQPWPAPSRIDGSLIQYHYRLDSLPPVSQVIRMDRQAWRIVGSWPLETGSMAYLWSR